MHATLATHPVTASRYVIGFATEADDADLRRLLRETPMPGPIQVSLEREPSFFAAARAEGGRQYTVAIRDQQTGQLAAMGGRSVQKVFVNGNPEHVGYLSQLRIAPEHRRHSRQLLRMGFDLLRQTRTEDEAPFDITTIVTDNDVARRLLEAGLPALPRYTPVDRILTMLLPVRGKVRPAVAPYQVLDQRAFKQIVVRGYSSWLRRCRWLLRLPPVGAVLPVACVVNFDGDLKRLDATLTQPTDCRWLALGLPASSPLAPVVRGRYRPRVYESILYVVHEPGLPVDVRDVRVEVAWL